ncbi:hypothetical protein GCM10022225_32290 [Plantactinospora mayteni]|uniref:HTH cro/C1-type domain-containing protein n=1 Tax=Plantactinospora mayteni TaxID=566021 RepID=A0ABQ4ELI2_9ACTN|nr:helix-turn-helix transcriptional regulator [Plantactinospora mayteni]GIG95607.1 hypothetical protein Pma05_21800 [Plantactinospora mayteni]
MNRTQSRSDSSPVPAIAAALRRERERTGISLAELARRAGIAKSTLSQLEAGNGNPSVETVWALGVPFTFPGDVPHRYEALAPGTFAVLVMEHS